METPFQGDPHTHDAPDAGFPGSEGPLPAGSVPTSVPFEPRPPERERRRRPTNRAHPVLWVLLLILLAVTITLQRLQASATVPSDASWQKQVEGVMEAEEITPPQSDLLVMLTRLGLAARDEASKSGGGGASRAIADSFLPADTEGSGGAALDRFRGALARDAIDGPDEGLLALDALEPDLAADSPLHADIDAARALFRDGPEALEPDALALLLDHHGFMAQAAIAGPDDPFTKEQVRRGRTILYGAIALIGVFGLGVLVGLVLLILGLVGVGTGEVRFDAHRPTDQNRGVWLEMLCIFLGGFLGVKVLATAMAMLGVGEDTIVLTALFAQWSLALVIFWPLLRGMKPGEYARAIGYVGVKRSAALDVLSGLGAYLAFLPILLSLAIVVVLVKAVIDSLTGAPPVQGSPVLDAVEQGGLERIVLGTLVVLWAPLVEETLFRGALQRQLRTRLGVLPTVLLVGTAFALLHGYMMIQLIIVGSLGVWLALVREWRGSLLPCIAIHMAHNSMVFIILLLAMRAMTV